VKELRDLFVQDLNMSNNGQLI